MRALAAPAIDYRALYKQMTDQTANAGQRELLQALEDRMVAAGGAYDAAMAAGAPDTVRPVPISEIEEYVAASLYRKRLVAKDGAGRWAYNRIRRSTAHCPYCLDGEVWEVDHYLPQAGHPDLSVYPGNLVPICHPCNHLKRDLEPDAAAASLLHPYFDRLPAVCWLFARIEFNQGGPVLVYSAHLPEDHGRVAARLGFHFARLDLSDRFRHRAAKVLVEMQEDVRSLSAKAGAAGLRLHFRAEADRLSQRDANTIEAAAYHAAADSMPFCAGHQQAAPVMRDEIG